MSAIFISYTGRDAEGKAMAEQVADWLREWGYESFFRDKELKDGVPAGSDWRQLLHARLAQCQLLIAVCSPSYEGSVWCITEIAIAMDRGHKLVPLQLGETSLPLLLQNKQAITIQEPITLAAAAAGEAPEVERCRIESVRQRLQQSLNDLLDWRAKIPRLADQSSPYPGLFSFDEPYATVFFGRDDTIAALEQKVLGFRGHRSEFLLLQGASGSGKSSLLRAGLIPRLRVATGQGFLVVDSFRPDRLPLETLAAQLQRAMARDGVAAHFTAEGSVKQLLDDFAHWRLQTKRQDAMVVLPIDQIEDLFRGSDVGGGLSKGNSFLEFLADLLAVAGGRVLVLATIRTDFLAVLESRQAILEQEGKRLRWAAETIPPIAPARYSEVIEGPARQVGLILEPGLTSTLVADTGSGDALPLLAFTLRELWGYHAARQFQPVQVERVGLVHLLCRDLKMIGGVSGSVNRKADEVKRTCSDAELKALRDAFLGHLVRINEEGEGGAAKQKAPLAKLPPASHEAVKRLVEERLLVSDVGEVEIAHEALLRTWPTLVGWIKEGQEELLQRSRVKRLCDEIKTGGDQQRRQALEQLAALAAAGGSDARAVRKEATDTLCQLLNDQARPLADREDTALVLALIGAEEPLRQCLADGRAPVALRRRAAESLGLLARRCGDRYLCEAIAEELEHWLRSDAFSLLVMDPQGWAEHDARLPLLQGSSRGLQLAASADFPLLGSGEGRVVLMLSLTALAKGGGLRILTELVEIPVWKLPLPGGEQLELVLVEGGEYWIGSLESEEGRDWYAKRREGCNKGVNVEVERSVRLERFAMVRHAISQVQWRAVAELPQEEMELNPTAGTYDAKGLWEIHAQPGALPVESVSWNDCREWLKRLNRWLSSEWSNMNTQCNCPILALPSESQWEASCRSGTTTPFHFGDTLDHMWANFNSGHSYGNGRQRRPRQRLVPVGFSGLVNRLGLGEMHGQLYEWCGDQWHPNPIGEGWPRDGQAWEGLDPDLEKLGTAQKDWKLLRGGSWFSEPHYCRAASRISIDPAIPLTSYGFRPCCLLP